MGRRLAAILVGCALVACTPQNTPDDEHIGDATELLGEVVCVTDSDEWKVALVADGMYYHEAVGVSVPEPYRLPTKAEAQVLRWLTYQSDDGSKTIDIILIFRQVLWGNAWSFGSFQIQQAVFIEPAIMHNAFINGKVVFRITFVQSINMFHQFLSLFKQLLCHMQMLIGYVTFLQVFQDAGQLLDEMALGGLVGMKFQTEIAQSQFLQTTLNNG